MMHSGDGSALSVSILLVGAQEENLRVLSAILSDLPDVGRRGAAPEVRLVRASSGPAALRALLLEDFALILLDTAMPEMDSVEVAHSIKQRDQSKHIPILFLTAERGDRERVFRGDVGGAVDFLDKPIDPRVARARVAVFIELFCRERERVALAIDNVRLSEGAQEAARIREEFLSIASHELRTPLSALKLQVQSLELQLRRTPIEADRLFAKVTVAQRQVERLTRLVNELLDVSRIAAGRLELDREPTDLGELVCDVASQFTAEIERSGSSIELDLQSGVTGHWDRLRLDQVITNLLQNAVKYGRAKPIRVSVAAASNVARIEVTDQGIGIPAIDLQRIFGRFERAVSSRAYGGMGVGLFIVDQILKAHGGTIAVRSEPGVGSCFMVELPGYTAGTRAAVAPKSSPSPLGSYPAAIRYE